MISVTLTFAANGQQLVRTGCEKFAANTVNYIQAKFNLGEGWDGFDSVRAVWQTDFAKIATVLDNDGNCTVPQEVLKRVNSIMVNLVGSISDGTELTDRLTTYKIKALDVNGATNIDGTETAEITPSQFEQFVAIVRDEVAEVKDIDRVELNPDYTLTIYFSDGTSTTTGSIRGEEGPEGPAGETGNGIESVDLTGSSGNIDTYTISFTDGSTTTFTVTNGEVTMEQLSQVLPTDTASGDIASFPDGTDLIPLQSLTVTLEPTQDLHGYDKPWVGGAGKNKFNPDNTTADSYINNVGEIVGGMQGWSLSDYIVVASSTEYTFNPNSTEGNAAKLWFYDANKEQISYIASGQRTFTTPANCVYMRFSFRSTSTNIQLELGSTATAYEPYSNICPITGWTGCNVSQSPYEQTEKHTITGKNLFNAPNDYAGHLVPCHIDANQPFVASANISCGIRYYDASKVQIDYWSSLPNSYGNRKYRAITASQVIEYVEFYGSGNPTDLMIELGNSPSDYEPYGNHYSISWQTEAGTVYGGTLDLVSGVLTVDRAMVDMGSLDWRYNGVVPNGYQYAVAITNKAVGETNFVCSAYATGSPQTTLGYICGRASTTTVACNALESTVADFIASVSGQQLVYELATPQTYQLTPQQINTLLGQNNVWSEQGSVAVVYKADIQLWIEKKLA